MSKLFAIFALSAALVAGCGTAPVATTAAPPAPVSAAPVVLNPTAPAFTDATAGQAMVIARDGYQVAVTAAIAYGKLPTCSATQRAPCHDPALLAQLQKADTVAYAALDAGDAILRQPGLGSTARDRAITAAQSALAAFTTLTGAIK